jgi:electron transport complex protein RnfD
MASDKDIMYPENFIITSSPYLRQAKNTRMIMLDVLIALLPCVVAATIIYGTRSLLIILVAVAFAVLSEGLARRVMKRPKTIGDLSAVVTGLILALNLPIDIPLWQVALGSVFAIVVCKQIFGGLGQNIFNPAMVTRIAMMSAFSASFMTASRPVQWILDRFPDVIAESTATSSATASATMDAMSNPTPLQHFKDGGELFANVNNVFVNVFLGAHDTLAIGETCIAAILIGGMYLLLRGVIKFYIPVSYIGTVAVLSLIYGGFNLSFVGFQMVVGGLLFAAFFMATDYATSPLTNTGKVVYGIGLGLITCFIRFWGSLPEGVSYSIIIMNILTPHIDRWTRHKAFGQREKESMDRASAKEAKHV